ncbi:ferredoxin [Streptomyces sp. Root369]|uniref:ferredoxin n=1 Tax=Streptomyces sp. Root369 TaxID=1736523 RepID=UPI00070A1595|nr:ferredoxin [Streptomyces sp. Root369]KQV94134.1 ferredoxin [Streptomyces sp. Root369]
MKITVDESKCVSGGQCVLAAPEVFDQRDEDGVVILLNDAPEAPLHEQVREAAAICPAAAITLQES